MSRSPSARVLKVARLAYGLALLSVPARLAAAATGTPAPPGAVTVMRVLGVRHVVQAAWTMRSDGPVTRRLTAAADVLHLCSLAPIALICDSDQRRLVAADAVVEAFLALSRPGSGGCPTPGR